MSNSELLKRLGLFIKSDFLPTELCSQGLLEARYATATPALVLSKRQDKILEPQLDRSQRMTAQLEISEYTKQLIKDRLLAIRPMLEQHFELKLTTCQNPLFYRYKEGDFFAAHQDCTDKLDAPEFLKQRRVSIVLFLNRMTGQPAPEGYCGGALAFYGLLSDPHWTTYGFPFIGEPGTLVAFRSNVWHEVKPVTYGERYTAVSWFV